MMYSYYDNKTDREQQLEYELERMRDEENLRREEAQRQRQERREEYRRQSEAASRTASTWPEALHKQAYLFEREANDAGEYDSDNHFGDGAAACKRALEIWKEVEATKQEAIAELERQIEAIKTGIRVEVGKKLMAEANNRGGWKGVARSITKLDDSDLDIWLNW